MPHPSTLVRHPSYGDADEEFLRALVFPEEDRHLFTSAPGVASTAGSGPPTSYASNYTGEPIVNRYEPRSTTQQMKPTDTLRHLRNSRQADRMRLPT